MSKRLYRSRGNRMIAGVCEGIAESYDLDPTIVRLGFVLLALFHGIGLVAYLALWIVMPARSNANGSQGPRA
ncbi:MAG TPA: PspC domain-containing protein [Chloroflexota bacterium]|nr:PspC domain-containing protein [Chloroflexota bacterium]